MILYKKILEAFPNAYPQDLVLTDSYGDAEIIVGHFANMQWLEVNKELIRREFDAPFFFSKEAFVYFFPIYMVMSMTDYATIECALEACLMVLSPTDDPVIQAWRAARLNSFTAPQISVICEWLHWISGNEGVGNEIRELSASALESVMNFKKGQHKG